MYKKIIILLIGILSATSQAQIPSPSFWYLDGDHMLTRYGDSLDLGSAAHPFDTLFCNVTTGINLDSLKRLWVDSLFVGDSLRVAGKSRFTGSAIFDSDIDVDSLDTDHITGIMTFAGSTCLMTGIDSLAARVIRTIGDVYIGDSLYVADNVHIDGILYADSIDGHSPMYFLSKSYFGTIDAETLLVDQTIAPSFSATDLTNTQGYWDIIAGPDSIEWTLTSGFALGHISSMNDVAVDEADSVLCFHQYGANSRYRLSRRDPDLTTWATLGSTGSSSNTNGNISMCLGGGDSVHVVYTQSYTTFVYQCWDGSSWGSIDTLAVNGGNYAGWLTGIARHGNGVLHVVGTLNPSGSIQKLGYWTNTGGSWSAPDTVYSYIQNNGGIDIDAFGYPHIVVQTITGGALAAGVAHFWNDGSWHQEMVVSSASVTYPEISIDGTGAIWCALKFYAETASNGVDVYKKIAGWSQVGTRCFSGDRTSYPDIILDSSNFAHITAARITDYQIRYAYWDGASWAEEDPSGADGMRSNVAVTTINNPCISYMDYDNSEMDFLIKMSDPGQNTGHRDGALLIRSNYLNNAGDIYIVADSGAIHLEDTVFVGNISVLDNVLISGSLIVESINAKVNTGYWSGTITHDSLTAAAVSEDVKLISNFPAKYKILEIFIDNTEVWDDGAGPISAATISAGWTGAAYDDLIQTQDIYTAVTQIGDAAGEISYVQVQGGIRPSWSADTDIYLRFSATGANLSTLTTGSMTIYIVYQVF